LVSDAAFSNYLKKNYKVSRSISVIIPNYNGRLLLEEILPPLYSALRNAATDYEVIVSDDASTDESVIFLKTYYPEIIITENETNSGFSITVNKGAVVARKDLLFFLNNDVKLTDDYFKNMLHYFDKEDVFGVNGRVIGWNDDTIQDAAKLPYFQGAKLKTSRNYYYKGETPSDVYTFYLTGSNALIDRKKFWKIGGFDEIFSPFYCEDLELSVRAWRYGWTCYYEHQSVCRHKVSATTSSLKRRKYVELIYNRNKFIFHYIHLSGLKLVQYYGQIGAEAIGKLFIFNTTYLVSLIRFIKRISSYKHIWASLGHGSSRKNIQQIIKHIKKEIREDEVVVF
jgi:GT2 family glycosyltransferase